MRFFKINIQSLAYMLNTKGEKLEKNRRVIHGMIKSILAHEEVPSWVEHPTPFGTCLVDLSFAAPIDTVSFRVAYTHESKCVIL